MKRNHPSRNDAMESRAGVPPGMCLAVDFVALRRNRPRLAGGTSAMTLPDRGNGVPLNAALLVAARRVPPRSTRTPPAPCVPAKNMGVGILPGGAGGTPALLFAAVLRPKLTRRIL